MVRENLIVPLLALAALTAQAFECERVFRPERYGRGDTNVRPLQAIDEASWIWLDGLDVWGAAVFTETRAKELEKVPSHFVRFRRDFEALDGEPLEVDVSADERYVLLLDGREISRGPHRGLAHRWHYQSYRITALEPGTHRLEAVCWQLGEHAPLAQVSVRGGFVLKASGRYDAALTTGRAKWQAGRLSGTRMTVRADPSMFGVGSVCEVRGTSFLGEEPAEWTEARVVRGPVKTFAGLLTQGWMLFPSALRDMMFERKAPGRIVRGTDLLRPGTVIPAHAKAEALWDLGNYYCAYPFVRTSGGRGARIVWRWNECLMDESLKKGDRSAFEGLDLLKNRGDTFLPDGRDGAVFTTPWWRCGKWCKIEVETADEPLVIAGVEFAETRYPAEFKASFECDDPLVARIRPLCERSLLMCMHEMFFDCPYYEQQMYPGDSRVQYLVSGLAETEDRMVRNAITLYDTDRRENGMIPMNCPTRGTQDALGFSCCEVIMHGDYAWQHANRDWLRMRLPGMNHTLMGFEAFARADGLLGRTPGWNFVDWVPDWNTASGGGGGVPPDGNSDRPNAEINLQYLYALESAIRAERAVGEESLAAHWEARANRLKAAIREWFWDRGRGLFASDIAHANFSEHAQCLALLCDVVTGDEAKRCFESLVTAPDLARGTIYYKHYLFETFFRFGRADLFFANLGFWKDCADWGLSTVLETPGAQSRSDCHGWGSHPLWHLHTGVAGVRSAAPWYGRVLVAPQPAHLKFIRSVTPTPKGDVRLDLRFGDGKASGTVTLPDGLDGDFEWHGVRAPLHPGANEIRTDRMSAR